MALTNFMRLVILALAFRVLSVHAAPTRFVTRDTDSMTSSIDDANSTAVIPTESSEVANATNTSSLQTSQCALTEYKASHANPREPTTLWIAVPNTVHRIAAIRSNKIPVKHNGDFGSEFSNSVTSLDPETYYYRRILFLGHQRFSSSDGLSW